MKNTFSLRIEKQKQELAVLQGDRIIERMPCSTGRNKSYHEYSGTTPIGVYEIREIFDSRKIGWKYDGTEKRRPYGPWTFSLDDNPNGLAIHGTDQPYLLGKPVTLGCIRVNNENIARLKKKYVALGNRVEVLK